LALAWPTALLSLPIGGNIGLTELLLVQVMCQALMLSSGVAYSIFYSSWCYKLDSLNSYWCR